MTDFDRPAVEKLLLDLYSDILACGERAQRSHLRPVADAYFVAAAKIAKSSLELGYRLSERSRGT